LFTDYFDDVSRNYADQTDLLTSRGQKAVDMAYRGDEVAGGSPGYPGKDAQRGSATSKDAYYFVGVHLSFRLGMADGSRGGYSRWGKKGYGCPANMQ